MNRTQPLGGGIAIVAASTILLALVADVSIRTAAASFIPPQTAAVFAAMCSTDEGRIDPAWMRQSFENDHCSLPPEPPVLDGTKASRDQLTAGLAAARRFVASAERYQQCISSYVARRGQEPERNGKSLKGAFVTMETHRIVASQVSEKRVWDQITMAVDDFNAEGSECPQ